MEGGGGRLEKADSSYLLRLRHCNFRVDRQHTRSYTGPYSLRHGDGCQSPPSHLTTIAKRTESAGSKTTKGNM